MSEGGDIFLFVGFVIYRVKLVGNLGNFFSNFLRHTASSSSAKKYTKYKKFFIRPTKVNNFAMNKPTNETSSRNSTIRRSPTAKNRAARINCVNYGFDGTSARRHGFLFTLSMSCQRKHFTAAASRARIWDDDGGGASLLSQHTRPRARFFFYGET